MPVVALLSFTLLAGNFVIHSVELSSHCRRRIVKLHEYLACKLYASDNLGAAIICHRDLLYIRHIIRSVAKLKSNSGCDDVHRTLHLIELWVST